MSRAWVAGSLLAIACAPPSVHVETPQMTPPVEAPTASREGGSCQEPWPDDPLDRWVGFYGGTVAHPYSDARHRQYLIYDGRTVVIEWIHAQLPGCGRHGPNLQGIVRLHARMVGRTLQARGICSGWFDLAQLDEDGRTAFLLHGSGPVRLFRLSPSMVPPCVRQRWLRCSPVFELPPPGPWPGMPPEYTREDEPPLELAGLPSPDECLLDTTPSVRAPRAGFYATEPFRTPTGRPRDVPRAYALLDESSVVFDYDPARRPRGACGYGHRDDLEAGVHRFEARVLDDGTLTARLPCEGWARIGRFEDDALLLDGVTAPLFRDRSYGCEQLPYIVCRPIYRHSQGREGQPP